MVIALLLSFAVLIPQTGGNEQKPEAAQEREEKQNNPPKRGDTVVARGCVSGSVLESASLEGPTAEGFADFVTYRLTGDKKTIEEIRKEHDHHADIVTGELRTDLPTSTEMRGKKIGKTRIVVGMGPSRPGMPDSTPPMPVLKVKSFEHTGVPCR